MRNDFPISDYFYRVILLLRQVEKITHLGNALLGGKIAVCQYNPQNLVVKLCTY